MITDKGWFCAPAKRHLSHSGHDHCSTGLASIMAWSGKLALATLTLFCSACAVSNPVLSSGPSPRVEDCMLLQQATPTKYVCGGKTYTAVQLADIRKSVGIETH